MSTKAGELPYANHSIPPTIYDKSRASDAYYSFLDDPALDLLPDVLIGRLPVDDDETDWEIANLVRKIIRYEPLSSAAWADSVLLVSGSSADDFTFENELLSGFQNFFDSVLTYYPPTGRHVVQLHRLAYPLPDDSTQQRIFGNKIAASMKRGKWLTAFFDHGSPFYWAGSFFARSYETFSTAQGRPSIVFSIGSNTSHFDFTSNWGQEVQGTCDVGQGCMVPPPSSIACESPGYQHLDKCDVVSERLLVQPGGAVAVIGYSRSQLATYAQTDFTNLFRCIADQNPSTLGELLVGARMFNLDLVLNPTTARNLMLLGDPALDIRTRAPAAVDTFDVAVGISDIGSRWAPYLQSNSTITVNVRNTWRTHAVDVEVELWNGHPDSTGSALLSSTVLDTVRAYGKTSASFSASGLDGNVELFVRLDPDDVLPERSETNNIASREFLANRYEGDFPRKLDIGATRPIVIADMTTDMGKEFLVTGAKIDDVQIQCFSAMDTIPQWSFSADSVFYNYSNPTVGHLYKSARKFIAFQYGHPLKVRLINAETGSIASARLSNDRSAYTSAGVVTWTMSDFGADDASMELTTLLYRDHTVEDSLIVRAFAPSGPILSSAVVEAGLYLAPATLAVADVNKNGDKEVLVSSKYVASGGELKMFSYTGAGLSLQWQQDLSDGTGSLIPSLVLFDRDGDGNVEILCDGHYSNGSFVRTYSATGSSLWLSDVFLTDPHTFSAGDIDANGTAEVVVADLQRLRVVASSTGSVLDTRTMRGDPVSPPYLVDIDADGKLDVVVLYEERDANEYFYPQPYLVHLYVLDENLDQIGALRTFRTPAASVCAPAIDDIDDDGKYEMVYASTDGYLHVFELGTAAGELAWQQRFANELLSGLNEQPIVGTYTAPMSLYQRSRMLGEVVLDSIAAPSLYVGHGTEIRVDTPSPGHHLRAYGSVRIKGSANEPIVFHSRPAASAQATWAGIYVDNRAATPGDSDTLSYVDLSDASVGLDMRSPLWANWVTISNTFDAGLKSDDWLRARDCTVSLCEGDGFYVGDGADAVLDNCVIEECVVNGLQLRGDAMVVDSTTVRLCDTGIYATGGGTVSLSRLIVSGCGTYGAVIKGMAAFEVTASLFRDCDLGLELGPWTWDSQGGSIENSTFVHNTDAVRVEGDIYSVPIALTGCIIDSTTTTGLYIGTDANTEVRGSTFNHSAVGIYSYGSDPAIRSHNIIQYNTSGIKCDNSSHAAVESCTVNNNTYGVNILSGNPDLGHIAGGSSAGYNIMKPNTTYHVRNADSWTTIAQQNYWPQKATAPPICYPKPSMIYGSVDTTYGLCDPPSLASPSYWGNSETSSRMPGSFRLAQNYPNPFNPTTTISYDVPTSSAVHIAVYDVAGRLVVVLVNEQRMPGSYVARWDGHDRRGQPVASGVYFVRMTAGPFTGTRKLLLLK